MNENTKQIIARIAGLDIKEENDGTYQWVAVAGSGAGCKSKSEAEAKFFEHIEELAALAARKVST